MILNIHLCVCDACTGYIEDGPNNIHRFRIFPLQIHKLISHEKFDIICLKNGSVSFDENHHIKSSVSRNGIKRVISLQYMLSGIRLLENETALRISRKSRISAIHISYLKINLIVGLDFEKIPFKTFQSCWKWLFLVENCKFGESIN